MQFKKAQRTELAKNWNQDSWFYSTLGEPARDIITKAYGLSICSPRDRVKSQEDVTMAMSFFARKIGCEKSHVVHALLSGSIKHLLAALGRIPGNVYSTETIQSAWEEAFRSINVG